MTVKPGVRTWILVGLLLVLAAVPPLAALLKEPFYLDLLRRVMIFAIAATSLNLILGYGGMVSFGHAAYLGLGAYAVGVLSHHGIDSGWLQWTVAIGDRHCWRRRSAPSRCAPAASTSS